jgi:hypothetical protein
MTAPPARCGRSAPGLLVPLAVLVIAVAQTLKRRTPVGQ